MFSEDRIQRLVDQLQMYVSGEDRSALHVRKMEGEFAQLLDDDERFADLQYTLSMFGADSYDMEDQLVKECEWAIKTLHGICVYHDCQAEIVKGTRFCSQHQPS